MSVAELPIVIDRETIAGFYRARGIRKLSLLGSVLRDDFDPARSDVDVLVEFLPGVSVGLKFFGYGDELAEFIGHKVDFHTAASLMQILPRRSGARGRQKKDLPSPLLPSQAEESEQLMARFVAEAPHGAAAPPLEVLVRAALFKPATTPVGRRRQGAAARVDAADQPQPGEVGKGRAALKVPGLFGFFELGRDDDDHAGQQQGHSPADAALGLEGGDTPARARLRCLAGADEASDPKAQTQNS